MVYLLHIPDHPCSPCRVNTGGPIDSNFNFIVGGPAVATTLAKSTFLDTCSWEDGKLRVDKLRTPDKSYEIRTLRWLEDDGNTIHCVSFLGCVSLLWYLECCSVRAVALGSVRPRCPFTRGTQLAIHDAVCAPRSSDPNNAFFCPCLCSR